MILDRGGRGAPERTGVLGGRRRRQSVRRVPPRVVSVAVAVAVTVRAARDVVGRPPGGVHGRGLIRFVRDVLRRFWRSAAAVGSCVPRFVIFREHDTLARPRLHPDRRFGAVRRARLHHRGRGERAPRCIGVSLVTGSGGVGGRPASRHRSRAREGSYGSRFDARTLRTRLGATQTPSAPCASGRTSLSLSASSADESRPTIDRIGLLALADFFLPAIGGATRARGRMPRNITN